MSTAPNLRMLFNTYHNGFDNYGRWLDHHKAMHAKHPLECAGFGAEWLRRWEAVGRLLDSRGRLEIRDAHTGRWWVPTYNGLTPLIVDHCLLLAIEDTAMAFSRRRVTRASDGTVVKEWGVT